MILVFIVGCPSKSKKKEVVNEKISEATIKKYQLLSDQFKKKEVWADIVVDTGVEKNIKEVYAKMEAGLFKGLFKGNDSRAFMVGKNSSLENKDFEKLQNMIDNVLDSSPEDCSLYVLRAWLSAYYYQYENMFDNVSIIENFNPEDWSAKLLMAFSYFQRWEYEKAADYFEETLSSYCKASSEEVCSDDSDDFLYGFINNIKSDMKEEYQYDPFSLSKESIPNHKNCYAYIGRFRSFFDKKRGNDERIKIKSWKGECRNGLAEGKGSLMYENGTKANLVFKEGIANGPAEIIYDDGDTSRGLIKNGKHYGRWITSDSNGKVVSDVSYDEKMWRSGKGFAITSSLKSYLVDLFGEDEVYGEYLVKFEGNFKYGEMIDGKAYCFYGTEKEREVPYFTHRTITIPGQLNLPMCKSPNNWKDIRKIEQEKREEEKKRINKLINEDNNKKQDCSIMKGFEHLFKILDDYVAEHYPASKKVEKERCPDANKFCREHNGLNWSDKSEEMYEWEDAIKYCEKMGGRMPTVSEVRTLLKNCPDSETGGKCKVTDDCLSESKCWDKQKCGGCEYDKDSGKYSVFGDIGVFKTISENIDDPDTAFSVSFLSGTIRPGRKNLKGSVLCVK